MKTKLLVLGALFASLCISAQGQLVDKTPVLHLSFDQVSGATAGSIVTNTGTGGSAMNGTVNVGAAGTLAFVPGKFGNALSILGTVPSDASVRIANAVVPLTVGNTWTVAMWIQTSAAGGCYAYQGSGGWVGGNSTFYLNNGGGVGDRQGGVRNGQGWEEGSAAINDGLWHHLVITCSGTTKTLYLDGNVDAFPVAAGSYNGDGWSGTGAGAQFWIGGNPYNGDGTVNLNGLIDEVYVFDKALSTNDVQKLFSNNTLPIVPVTVTVAPASGYRGQVVTVTATATPAAGTVTNATVNLSALNLSATATMVESSANVYTYTFTVPNNAPFGARNVRATVIDTEPLIGSGGTTFTVVPLPPTNAIILTQLTNTSVYVYTEVSFHFGTTNDAPTGTFPMTYAWYKNSVLVSTNAMGPYYTFLTTPADNGAQIYAIGRVANTNFSSIAVTSAVVTLTVNSGTPVYTNGLKQELFVGGTRANVEIGNVGPGIISLVTNADSAGGFGDNHARRYSGYFIPPTTDAYVFFVASDDDSDVFLSTDTTPASKRLIAQENGWSNRRNWLTSGTTGTYDTSQKRSDLWSPDPVNGVPAPYAAGIPLVAGQKYYFESVMHNGGGGDHWGVTYQTTNDIADPNWSVNFVNGTESRMTAASNNIAVVTWPGTSINWTLQPKTSVTVYEGQTTNFLAIAVSDAEMTPNYQWYLVTSGGSLPGTPLTGKVVNGTSLNMSLIPANYNNAQIYCVASTEFGGLSITSSVATLTVIQSVFEAGWVLENKWTNTWIGLGPVENGTAPARSFSCVVPGFEAGLDNPGSQGQDNTIQMMGYFVAPTNGNYVFFITSHDDGDLFLSTDNTPANKRRIAQESNWSGNWHWNGTDGTSTTIVSNKRSDTFVPSGGTTPPYAAGIPLNAGQRYYMEVVHDTSLWGNEQVGVTYRIMESGSVTAPADGSLPNCTGNVVGMSAIRCAYVAFTQQPTNVTSAPMGYATFSAAGVTDSQYPVLSAYGCTITAPTNVLFYQWYKNGSPITNATSPTLTLGPLMPSDSGAQINCTMRALGYANDALTPIWSNSLTATITISPQSVFEPGLLQEDWWTNATSRSVVEFGSVGSPDFTYTTPMFEGPNGTGGANGGDGPRIDFAQRISGFFVPPTTDLYVFFTDSDDDSDFFISTDASPANKRLVAQEAGWSGVRMWLGDNLGGGSTASQKRSDGWSPDGNVTIPYQLGISLNGGQLYYIEQVHHNGAAGGTHTTATFKVYSGPDPVDGDQTQFVTNRIGMYVPRIQWVAFLQQPNNATALSGGNSVTFTVVGTNDPVSIKVGNTGNPLTYAGGSPLQYQWYKNGTPIPGATGSSYTQPYVLPSDQGAQFVCALRALGYADNSLNRIYSNSVAAVLTVVTDTVPPTISYAAMFQNTNQVPPQFIVNVTFSKWMNAASLSNATYTVSGATVTNVSVASNHRTVQLLLNQMPTLPLNVTVTGATDLTGNAIAVNSSAPINGEKLNFSDVGTPGTDPAYPSHIWIAGSGDYIVSAEGSDIWNANDGCNFGWELKTNDFDVVVRGVSITPTSAWAKMGLMVRETLDATSREWSIQNEPLAADGGNNLIDTAMRDTTGAASVNWQLTSGALPPPGYPNAWLRLKRTISGTNDVLDGYYSTNGISWVHATSYNVATNATPLTNVVYVGLCTTAHNNDVVSDPAPSPFRYYNTVEYAGYNSSYVASVLSAHLTIGLSGSNVIVSWTPTGGHLEASPAISGPGVNWQTVTSSNPATNALGSGARFFRVLNP